MNLAGLTLFNSSIATQEAQITKLQQELSSNVSVSTPDQGPAAYETATLGNDQVSAIASENTTQATIQSQLGSADTAYQSVSNVLNSVQAIIEQGLNGTESAQNLQSLSNQITSASQQLVALGNTTDASGNFVFGGSRSSIAPFQSSASGTIVYFGDAGQSLANITPDTKASTIANGDVFNSALSGNGFASVSATSTNTGTGVLISEGIASPSAAAAFQASSPATGAVTVNFITGASGLEYTTTVGAGAPSAPVAVSSGGTLQIGGIDYQLNGTPAAGDSFTVSPSRPQSVFTLTQNLAKTLSQTASTPAEQAQTSQQLNNDLLSLAQYQQAVTTAQAQNGVTLQAITNAGTSNSNQSTAVQAAVQNAIGVNTPAVITQLNDTVTAVEAAFKAFSNVQSLSLFNYL